MRLRKKIAVILVLMALATVAVPQMIGGCSDMNTNPCKD